MLKAISDRILRIQLKRDEKELKIGFLITGLVIILLFANIIYLNLLILRNNSAISSTTNSSLQPVSPTQLPIQTPTLNQANPTSIPVQYNQAAKIANKDYYINLGSGSNQSTEWADVAGTVSTFDIAAYKNIKEARLETTTNVPTANGTISMRLFNKTGGYAVWNSERTVNAEAQGSLLISEKLNYDHGPKLYSLQMKSQLGVQATLVQSRIHIVAE